MRVAPPHYYNENDTYCADWLQNLMDAGHIPRGVIDRRSIADVQPADLSGFRQCHFFAGIGGWSLAARIAGWPDDRELWTGSAPCQPFSVAGKQKAQGDDRHLWPDLFRLLRAGRPAVFVGEQVAAAVGHDWLDGIITDLEGIGYACGAAVIPACAVDAPHRRDRLWFVADALRAGSHAGAHGGVHRGEEGAGAWNVGAPGLRCPRADRTVADPSGGRCSESREGQIQQPRAGSFGGGTGFDSAVPDTEGFGQREQDDQDPSVAAGRQARPVPVERGHWDGAWWVIGHDGKARRVNPGIRMLANGVPARVGKLRAFGNAIVPEVAAQVLIAYLETRP